MGRASRQQAAVNRERVIQQADQLFRERGVENVSIADVMASAGLTVGGFYKQFASKDALVAEAFDAAFLQASDSWQRTIEESRHQSSDALTEVIRRYFEPRPAELSCPVLAFSGCVSTMDEDATPAVAFRAGLDELLQRFREAARQDDGSGQRSDDDVLLLFAATIGAGILCRSGGDQPWLSTMQQAIIAASDG